MRIVITYCRIGIAAGLFLGAVTFSPVARAAEGDLVFGYTRLDVDAGASTHGDDVENWDGEGWSGTDYDRFWWKTLGETSAGSLETADVQLLYSHYIAKFWDLQGGYRHEFGPGRVNQAVISLQGLAPYWFETDAELFLGGPGTVGGRVRLAYELLWTQRLIMKPEFTLDWNAGADRAHGVGDGVRRIEFELQTRYEITREFAPYVALRYERDTGETADLVRASGGQPESIVLSAGLRLIL